MEREDRRVGGGGALTHGVTRRERAQVVRVGMVFLRCKLYELCHIRHICVMSLNFSFSK